MKTWTLIILLCNLSFLGCTTPTTSTTPTSRVELIANAVEDGLSLALVPVLTRNPSYVPSVQAVAATLGTFSGSLIVVADVDALFAKVPMSAEDRRLVTAVVVAAWSTYSRRYAEQVNATLRPDVKLFLAAVSRGITSAVAAVPTT